jgi:putative oxidoreductase
LKAATRSSQEALYAMLSVVVVFAVRMAMVGLFLPFSALDKVLNFDAAVGQADKAVKQPVIAVGLIAGGFGIEVFMSLAVLTGVADRLAALVLAGYCIVTALLWKQFWATPDFRLKGPSQGRDLFWDFLKNFSVAGGFLLLALGTSASGVQSFLADPLASSHPYAVSAP